MPLSSAKTTLFFSLIGLVGSSDSLEEEEEEVQSSDGRITRQGRRGDVVLKGGGKLVEEATRQLRMG